MIPVSIRSVYITSLITKEGLNKLKSDSEARVHVAKRLHDFLGDNFLDILDYLEPELSKNIITKILSKDVICHFK